MVVVAEAVEYLVFGIETEYFAEQGVVLLGSIGICDGEHLRFGYEVELIGLSGFTLQHDTEIGGDGVGGLQLSLAVNDFVDNVGLQTAALLYLKVFVRREDHLSFGRHLHAYLFLEEGIDFRGLLGPGALGGRLVAQKPVELFFAHRCLNTLVVVFRYHYLVLVFLSFAAGIHVYIYTIHSHMRNISYVFAVLTVEANIEHGFFVVDSRSALIVVLVGVLAVFAYLLHQSYAIVVVTAVSLYNTVVTGYAVWHKNPVLHPVVICGPVNCYGEFRCTYVAPSCFHERVEVVTRHIYLASPRGVGLHFCPYVGHVGNSHGNMCRQQHGNQCK